MLRNLLKGFSSAKTFFDKILSKEIPSKMVYEDQHFCAFEDVKPFPPLRIIVIPKDKDGFTGIGTFEAA